MKIMCLLCEGVGYTVALTRKITCHHCSGAGFIDAPVFKPYIDKDDIVRNGKLRNER